MSAEFVVRVAAPRDDAPIGELLSVSYPELMASSYDQAVLAATLPFMTRAIPALLSSGTFYLAEGKDRRVVGCGGWTRERPGSGEIAPDLAHIRHFATHPDWVRHVGVRRLECYASLNAERFYAALGFASVRRIELPIGPGLKIPSVLMERSM